MPTLDTQAISNVLSKGKGNTSNFKSFCSGVRGYMLEPSKSYRTWVGYQRGFLDFTRGLMHLDRKGSIKIVNLLDKIILEMGEVIKMLQPLQKKKEVKREPKTFILYENLDNHYRNLINFCDNVTRLIDDYATKISNTAK